MDQREYMVKNQAAILQSLSNSLAFANIQKILGAASQASSVLAANLAALPTVDVKLLGSSMVVAWPNVKTMDNLKVAAINDNILKLGSVLEKASLGRCAQAEHAMKMSASAIKTIERINFSMENYSPIIKKQNEELRHYFNSFDLPSAKIAEEPKAMLEEAVATLEEIFDRIEEHLPDLEARLDEEDDSEIAALSAESVLSKEDVTFYEIIQILPFFLRQSRENSITIVSLMVDYVNHFPDFLDLPAQDRAATLSCIGFLVNCLIFIYGIIV